MCNLAFFCGKFIYMQWGPAWCVLPVVYGEFSASCSTKNTIVNTANIEYATLENTTYPGRVGRNGAPDVCGLPFYLCYFANCHKAHILMLRGRWRKNLSYSDSHSRDSYVQFHHYMKISHWLALDDISLDICCEKTKEEAISQIVILHVSTWLGNFPAEPSRDLNSCIFSMRWDSSSSYFFTQ